MKKRKNYSLLLVFAVAGISAGTLNAQQNKQASPALALNVQEISTTKWNTPDGLTYQEGPGINLGAVSFEAVGDKKTAFLSNASNEIIITDRATGKAVKKFSVSFAPRDFVYEKGAFFVLDEKQVTVYSESGKRLRSLAIPAFCLGVERMVRFGSATYLLLPSGNSMKIEVNGKAITPKEYEGWITAAGHFVLTKLKGDNTYYVKVTTAAGKSYEKTFSTDKKVAGIYVTGATASRICLDVQTFISENPISVERNIASVELTAAGIGNTVASIKVPDCYYVLSNKDFQVMLSGNILNMITTPQGAVVCSLTEMKAANAKGYPASLLAVKYHFNDHLLQMDTK